MVAAISFPLLVKIHLGPLALSPHGAFTAIGFAIGARFLLVDTRRRGIADVDVYAVLLWAALGAFAGARVAYVVNHWSSFESPSEWFEVWNGGISLLGGIAGALLVGAPVARRHGLSFFPLMDLVAPWLPLGIAVGRIGDLIVGDHLGQPTDLPIGIRCPDVVDVGRTVASSCPPGEVVHLTALYDLLAAATIAAILIALRRRPLRLGERTLLLGVLYGSGRFALDFLRADDRRLGLTGSQWTALAVVVAAGGLIALRRHRRDHVP